MTAFQIKTLDFYQALGSLSKARGVIDHDEIACFGPRLVDDAITDSALVVDEEAAQKGVRQYTLDHFFVESILDSCAPGWRRRTL